MEKTAIVPALESLKINPTGFIETLHNAIEMESEALRIITPLLSKEDLARRRDRLSDARIYVSHLCCEMLLRS